MDKKLILRRLLLAKEFYLKARENSKKVDAVNKMMAIHNYHIAIEIVLKAIILSYNIRTDKQLNIDFESMMSEISNKIDKSFPYRQELRSLNMIRGLIQHQGIEPDQSSIEDFEVITRSFLNKAHEEYFDVDFSELSRVSLIKDKSIRQLLEKASQSINDGEYFKSAVILNGTFKLVSPSIIEYLLTDSSESAFFVNSRLHHASINYELGSLFKPIEEGFESVFKRIQEAETYTAILSSGVQVADLKRFNSNTFSLLFTAAGNPIVQSFKEVNIDKNECLWRFDFMVSTILLWQQNGLEPCIGDKVRKSVPYLMNWHERA